MSTLSIVMVSYNRKADVLEGLAKIFEEKFANREVILVDNASSDGTAETVKSAFPDVKVLALESNIGISAFNRGFEVASGEFVLVLDDDSYPEIGAQQECVTRFRHESITTAILACRVLEGVDIACDVTGGWPERLITFWGCGAVLRRAAILEHGGYREDFFLYRNEFELAVRYCSAGLVTKYAPEIVIRHTRRSPTHASLWRLFRFGYRNDVFIFWSYYPLSAALNYLVKILLLSVVKGFVKYQPRDILFIWQPFLSDWAYHRRRRRDLPQGFDDFIDHPAWREMNLVQPKLTDLPERLLRGKGIF